MARRPVTHLLALAFLLACSRDDSVAVPGRIPACADAVVVVVTQGTSPQFDWSPRCRVAHVLVEPVPSGIGDRWSVRSDSNAITPPIRYGVAPTGGSVVNGPHPLEPGTEYRLILEARLSPNSLLPVAVRTFTP